MSKAKNQRYCAKCARERLLRQKQEYINARRQQFREKMRVKLERENTKIDMAKAIDNIHKAMSPKAMRRQKTWAEALKLAKSGELSLPTLIYRNQEIKPRGQICLSILRKLTTKASSGDYWSFIEGKNELTKREILHIGGGCDFCQIIYGAWKRGSYIGVQLWSEAKPTPKNTQQETETKLQENFQTTHK